MRAGVIVPQGWTGEYRDIDPGTAWQRTIAAAQRAETLGFDSIWVYDHFHTTPRPIDAPVFEAFTTLSALAPLTSRVRLGQLVSCAAYRNPALLAKMASTLDVVSGGRLELGLGAGWKEEEWRAYDYGFPSLRDRQAQLRDALEIVRRMFEPGHATYDGAHSGVHDAINLPKPVQRPRPPIVVGGNGREVTWRLAARYADELNLDNPAPEEMAEAMAVIASRCEEIGRDPASLAVSVHLWWAELARGRAGERLAAAREAGFSRAMALVRDAAQSAEAIDGFAETCRAAGLELAVSLA